MALISEINESDNFGGITVIIDGNSVVYRAFFKAPPLMADGMPTGVIHVFLSVLGALARIPDVKKVITVFDAKGKNKRHEMAETYKATRDAIPEDLAAQIDVLKQIIPTMGIPLYCIEGYEADDVIYTLVKNNGGKFYIVTKDKDLCQLVNENVYIYDYQTNEPIKREGVHEKYGVYPEKIKEMLALMGDTSDNIPGVKGIGPKTAVNLLEQYGGLDEIYAHLDEIKGKVRENLERDKAQAYLSLELVKLIDVPDLPIVSEKRDTAQMKDFFERYKLKLHLQRLNAELSINSSPLETEEMPTEHGSLEQGEIKKQDYILYVDGEIVASDGKHYCTYENGTAEYYFDIKQLIKAGVEVPENALDLMLAAWLADPDSGGLKKLKTETVGEFVAKATASANEITAKLESVGLNKLYYEMELPVARILAAAEAEGIAVDTTIVKEVAAKLKDEIIVVLSRISNRADDSINPNSPKQLGEYLYDRLGMKPTKKNKRGYSTDEDTLLELSVTYPNNSEIIDDILKYRELNKFLSTYTLNMLEFVSNDGRIHTDFKQTGTATGRLSSANPNLQNIPQGSGTAERLREAFKADNGYSFFSFDYSQIELRALAHLSNDANLRRAFTDHDSDIHTMTAMSIFHLQNATDVTPEIRRIAKAVNFGILYGLSAFGLARDTKTTAAEGRIFIERYFALYPDVKKYIDGVIEETRRTGFAETIAGRKRFIADISSRNGNIRQRAERMASNAPIQGSAADIIKLAMIECDKYIKENRIDAKLILQIHDELIFEVSDTCAAGFGEAIQHVMEGAARLSVPLKVNWSTGKNWGEL